MVRVRCPSHTLTKLDRLVEEKVAAGVTIEGKPPTRSSVLRYFVDFLQGRVIGADDQQVRSDLAKNYQVLLNLGNNINQLAKAYNQGLITRPVDTANYFEELSERIDGLIESQKSFLEFHKRQKDLTIEEVFDSLDAISESRP